MQEVVIRLGKGKVITIAVAVLAILAGAYFTLRPSGTTYQFVTVTRGPITEIVNVTGNTAPVKSLDLAFENGGTIATVNADVGTRVSPGDVIARLDTSDLDAQLAQAQANVNAQSAKLQSLKEGAQPADIAASRAAVAKAEQDLANFYASVSNTVTDAEAKSSDAVRNQLAPFFSNAETNNPQVTFQVADSQIVNDMIFRRIQSSVELNAWQAELVNISASSPQATLDGALMKASAHLTAVKSLLASTAQALISETGLPAATVDAYRSALAAAQSEVNTATTNVNGLIQSTASQKIAVTQLQAQLDLKVAGATASDLAAQQAQVEQAQANAQSIRAKLAKSALISPIAGIVTVQNGKVGQIAAPGAVIASIISDNNLEVEANVPETDIGKISIGNPVSMTFDAFPNETFTGKVFYIDPAETVIQGVVDFKVKVSFDKTDPRVKSGLTVNLDIKTREKSDALVLPQFAILQNDSGTFIETLERGAVVNHAVTLGIRDDQGNVEILSGATEGEEVLNVGLKQGAK